jgi:MoaA/NifB/PqqE/SkfB family radical SAM enzyme
MMDLAKRLGVLEVFLFDVIPTGELAAQRNCILTDADTNAIKEFRTKYNRKTDYPRIIHQTMFSSIAYPCVAEGCPAGMVYMHVRANGDICPCDFTPLSFGNTREVSLREAWNSLTQSPLYTIQSPCCRLSQPDVWNELDANSNTHEC